MAKFNQGERLYIAILEETLAGTYTVCTGRNDASTDTIFPHLLLGCSQGKKSCLHSIRGDGPV